MVFSSVNFLFLFFPAVIALYYMVPRKLRAVRNFILLVFSLAFYACGEPKYILLMLASITVNYLAGIITGKTHSRAARKTVLVLTVAFNLGALVYFKYTGFLLQNINSLFSVNIPLYDIVLPIGISFYTFQGLSYVIDVYRNDVPVQKNPLYLALYISLFPQLIAGPIVRYSTVAEEISDRRETLSDFASGIQRFIFGLAKKMLLANTMGAIADKVFGADISGLSAELAWLGAIAYSFQILFDFSGYSDMAIGIGRMFGFHFLENFDYPYVSRSITEFWRRWHISLGSWFRDYVYIPLGGNRVSKSRHIFNIAAVWILTGIWHGASWNFVLWGVYFGIILIFEKLFLLKLFEKIPTVFKHIYSLILIIIGWVIFRCEDITAIGTYLARMFNFSQHSIDNEFIYILLNNKLAFAACIVASIPASGLMKKLVKRIKNKNLYDFVYYYPAGLFSMALFLLSILYLVNSTFNPFIYFRF